jgi:tetratricopeptide (TPR) repeat protein/V8-like Glu-specific endopeptidase
MYRSSLFLTAALIGTTVALVQPVSAAISVSEVEAIAKAVVVEIKLQQNDSVGSGVIISRKGDIYTLVTNKHVVCGNQNCSKLPSGESYSLGLADGQRYRVRASSIRLLGSDLDLAIIQFRSNRNYAVAKLAAPGSLKFDDDVYTAGFPLEQPGFTFGEGKAIAVVNKRLIGDSGGYSIVYDAFTLPGMSGGGVFDGNGQLVAIHGQGDKYKENTEIDDKSRVDSKIGYNRGIPVRWLVQNLAEVGINLGTARSTSGIRAARAQVPATADEYFIAGFNKFVDPGDNVVAGKQQAIQGFSKAIQLNSRYQYAYFRRAIVYAQVQEFQKSLSDYNQSILLDPKNSLAYNNRGFLKTDKLNDTQGALSDYNQSILLDPKNSLAYNNRANLKKDKLNDVQGALSDYNQSIFLDPKNSLAYNNRANLKVDKLNDTQGAMADYNQAILLDPKYSLAYNNRGVLKVDKLNDIQGALNDFNQSIIINPKFFLAYNNRAILKKNKLNDIQGALNDYNQAIIINPKFSEAYNNRAILKADKLNDRTGAIQDFRQAARLFREQGNTQNLQLAIENLRLLGATE